MFVVAGILGGLKSAGQGGRAGCASSTARKANEERSLVIVLYVF